MSVHIICGCFSCFIHIIHVVLNFGLAGQSKVIFTFIFKHFEIINRSKIHNLMFYKMAFLPLPWSSKRDIGEPNKPIILELTNID